MFYRSLNDNVVIIVLVKMTVLGPYMCIIKELKHQA